MIEFLTLVRKWWNGKRLAHAPMFEALRWLVLDTHLISVSQVATHAQLDWSILVSSLKITLYESWIVQCWWHWANSNLQHTFLAKSNDFLCFSSDPIPASWSACLIVLVLTTTFNYSLKAFLTSTSLSSSPTMMVLTNTCCWARVMILGQPLLEGSTSETHSTNPRACRLRDTQQFWHFTCATPMLQQGYSIQLLLLW